MTRGEIARRALVFVALLLIVVNVAQHARVTSFAERDLAMLRARCDDIYLSIDRNTTYELSGRSLSNYRIDEWYYMRGCNRTLTYVRVLRPLNNSSRAIILVHDYGANYHSTLGLALELVARNYTVMQLNLPSKGVERIELFNKNYSESWIYVAVCNIVKAVTLLREEYRNVTSVGLVGVGFGGVAALLAARYDERSNYAVSIAGLGHYESSLESGSMLNYYVRSRDDLDACLDPTYLIADIDKPVMVLIGTDDEVSPLNPALIRRLTNNSSILVSLVPNANRFWIPPEWSSVLYKFLEDASASKELVRERVEVSCNGLELIVKAKSYENVVIVERSLAIGAAWSAAALDREVKRYSYLVLPSEYIIVDKTYYGAYGCCTTVGVPGYFVAALLLAAWLAASRRKIASYFRRSSIAEIVYLALLVLALFYTVYPTLWFFDRFHISLYSAAKIYRTTFPIASYLVFYTPILQLAALVALYGNKKYSRTFYALYVGIPAFTLTLMYAFLLLIGTRLYYAIFGLPTFSLLLLVAVTVLGYYVNRRASESESSE